MDGMKMTFFFGFQCSLLFSDLNLLTPAGKFISFSVPKPRETFLLSLLLEMFGGMVVVMVVAVLYEGLKTLREIVALYDGKPGTDHVQGTKTITQRMTEKQQDGATNNVQTQCNQETTPLIAKEKWVIIIIICWFLLLSLMEMLTVVMFRGNEPSSINADTFIVSWMWRFLDFRVSRLKEDFCPEYNYLVWLRAMNSLWH